MQLCTYKHIAYISGLIHINLKLIIMQRRNGEPFEDYKLRLKIEKKELKKFLRGKLFYDSRNGPYVRPKRVES